MGGGQEEEKKRGEELGANQEKVEWGTFTAVRGLLFNKGQILLLALFFLQQFALETFSGRVPERENR